MATEMSPERRKELQTIWDEHGRTECKKHCNDASEKLMMEDVSVGYYAHEANAIQVELTLKYTDEAYLSEKVRHLVEMMQIITEGTESGAKWTEAYDALRPY